MMVLVIVIGILMNLIVFLLYYRLERLNKKINSRVDLAPAKGIYLNDIFKDGQVNIQFKEVVADKLSLKTFGFSHGNGREDVAFEKKNAFRKPTSGYKNRAEL